MPITYDPPGIYGGTQSFGTLVEDILSEIQGYTASPDQITSLTNDIAAADTTIKVDDASGISPGLLEIGEEMVWVRSVDDTSNTVQVLPNGRGWRGTQASAHAAGTTVTISPAVPRSAVIRAVNDVIRAVYPGVYAVATTEFTYSNYLQAGYPIPAEAEAVLDVSWLDVFNNWQKVERWDVVNSMNTTTISTGSGLYLTGPMMGRTVRVVYAKRPTVLTSLTDDWTNCGLANGSKDLLTLGAIARLIPALDVSRLSVTYAAADELDQPRPLGSALSVAKQYKADYAARLAEERDTLNRRYPARWHRVCR